MVIYALLPGELPIPVRGFIILLATFCFWVGLYGRSGQYATFQEDLDEHSQREERYSIVNSRYEPIENRIEHKEKNK